MTIASIKLRQINAMTILLRFCKDIIVIFLEIMYTYNKMN